VSSVHAHRKTRKVRSTGRHRARYGRLTAAGRLTIAAPAVAVIGAIAVTQAYPAAFAAMGGGDSSHHTRMAGLAGAAAEVAESARLRAAASARLDRVSSAAGGGEPSATPLPSATTQSPVTAQPAAQPGVTAPAAPAPQPSVTPSPQQTTPASAGALSCSGSSTSGMVPENVGAIVNFLIANGYTDMAAAGIAGNIYQESGGNPESVGTGGGGLIGWTPLPAGYVTGNPAADLQTQLNALLVYNQQWSAYIPALNAATTPVEAADIYMDDFERPGIPMAGNREAAAEAVAQACGIES
jgi:hypothetical protein